ncbi:DICT domain-containing protein [Halogranum amylolyticum]|uniref:DICT domain-containing protein n=1 Tax=Halogranum amylolyticum TaxID=660520 RepID=A0A1H8W2C8_9EURY|nr:DICT sensory domain-containing protein [Halogranum amylolyticum]SEP21781.1 DICT domain-containing protein [Halogranum amylolyticum]
MSLSELIAGVEDHEKTLTVVNADTEVADSLREYFVDRNVRVVEDRSESTPAEYVVLGEQDRFLTASSVAELLEEEARTEPGFTDASYRPILDAMDETMFTSFDTGRMVAASREIEDRAWRAGRGQLHAGFQTLSTFTAQRDVYERLGARGELDVHVYATPDTDVPHDSSVRLHLEDTTEIARSWFVVYDGGGVDANKCALVAEEREPRSFFGFWTYGADTVDYILDHLTTTYALAETDGGDDESDRSGRRLRSR